ncbi:MAG: cytochrome c family protein [Alphaproteobacteria bacterium]|nr:cytochrome c family protein [Alphaproteobacteria bacterium]
MDSYELNKIAAAVIGAMLVTMVISILGGALVSPRRLAEPAYQIAAAPAAPAAQAAAPAQLDPIGPLLAAANAEAGAGLSRQCASCHTFNQGGRNGVGPNLYGVVGGPRAHAEGFNYSNAMKEAAQRPGDEGKWNYEALNRYLANPQAEVRGTRMAFAGLRRAEDRANLIAWLRTQSANPPPLP